MNSADLKFFRAVADARSICGAAGVLNTVQSNVTARVRALEIELGAPLFHRSRKGVTLTHMGDRLLPYAVQVGELLAQARKAVTDDILPSGQLRIGSLETTAALRLPPTLIRFAQRYPAVDVHIETGPTDHLLQRVLERKIDGAFVSGPVEHIDLEITPVVVEELVIVSKASTMTWEQLRSEFVQSGAKVLAFRSGCSYRKRMEAFLAHDGVFDARWMEMGTLDGIIGCVAAGIGIAMLPISVTQMAIDAGHIRAHALPNGAGLATTVFVRRKNDYLSTTLRSFINNVGSCASITKVDQNGAVDRAEDAALYNSERFLPAAGH
ncbi:LysR family transcriptional regulator [Tardiphaga sp. 709]|uniref:LysR family transcriptional regulator n=1 Tax=Tardiphaga sp. 709 TaxID=3076039 RepID=UPI0028E34235|nr:LysR substrate-binding domain-containing protein [Tardiphaga sp. 709]WNV11773.1 LysR substrate-binding domain-containing protein [Tardiphaga sp. 709]